MTRQLTPHQERYGAARRRNRDTALDRHAAELAKVDGKLREVLDHHRPVLDQERSDPECEGCDPGPYAEGNTDWPCSTWVLITGEDQEQWSPPIEDTYPQR